MAVLDRPKELLGPAAAARVLGISSERVKQLANEGKLPAIRTTIGRVFAPEDVARLAAERAQKRAAGA